MDPDLTLFRVESLYGWLSVTSLGSCTKSSLEEIAECIGLLSGIGPTIVLASSNGQRPRADAVL